MPLNEYELRKLIESYVEKLESKIKELEKRIEELEKYK